MTASGGVGTAIVGYEPVGDNADGQILAAGFSTVVGFVLAIRRPRSSTGWLFLVAEFWAPGIVPPRDRRTLVPRRSGEPVDDPPLDPDVVLAAAVSQGEASGIAISAIASHSVHVDQRGNLDALDHSAGSWAWRHAWAQPAFFSTLAAVGVGRVLQQMPAYRRSSGNRRLQPKWLYGGATVCGIGATLAALITSASSVAAAVSTLLASSSNTLRKRLQRLVERRFNRALEPTRVAVWLRRGGVAQHVESRADPVALPPPPPPPPSSPPARAARFEPVAG